MYNSNKNNKTFMIIGIISIFLIAVLITVGIVLYVKTDIFKSDEELFQRQFLQNLDIINQFTDVSSETEYRKLLEENNFNENTVLDLKYINSDGKEDKFTGNISGINNHETNLAYKDIKIDYENINVINWTYLKENKIYGLRFLDGTKFAVIDTANDITTVLKYLEIDETINVDKINDIKISDILNLSNEEIKQLEEKYLSVVLQNITKQNYTSKKDCTITLNNGQSVVTNSYLLTLDAQQVEIIYEKIIDQLASDEIILGKLENIDNKIKEIGVKLNKDIKTQFTEKFNEKLRNIKVESGLVVTVYELEGTTLRTTIEYGNKIYQIDINNTNNISIKYSNLVSENIQDTTISIKRENESLQINYEDNNNRKIELIRQLNINNNDIKSVTKIKYADNENIKDLELNIDRTIKIGVTDEIPTSFDKAGKVLLNDYDDEATSKNLTTLKNRILDSLRKKRDETNSELLNYIIQYNNQLEEIEKTEEENKRKKFNSKFELYEGENLEQGIVLNMLDEAGKNMSNYQVIGDNQIKIYIEEGLEKKELATEIKSKLTEEEGEKNYNIYIGYDENAKINQITIELVKPKEQ